jgi:hypothetical protein
MPIYSLTSKGIYVPIYMHTSHKHITHIHVKRQQTLQQNIFEIPQNRELEGFLPSWNLALTLILCAESFGLLSLFWEYIYSRELFFLLCFIWLKLWMQVKVSQLSAHLHKIRPKRVGVPEHSDFGCWVISDSDTIISWVMHLYQINYFLGNTCLSDEW